MTKNPISLILIAAFFVTSSGLMYYNSTSTSERILSTNNVKIEKDKDNNIWRVRDKSGKNKGTMRVKKKDTISWHAKGSDMVFTFSADVNNYFDFEEGLFEDGKTQRIGNNKKLRITLKDSAPKGSLIYEVYVVDADTFVVGNSPPKLIIY